MTIEDITAEQLAAIVAGLVREGLTFKAWPQASGLFTIRLLGGF